MSGIFSVLLSSGSGALPYIAEYIVVGGGAGGAGSGGGAGGYLEGTIVSPTGSYAVTIGGGGTAGRNVNPDINGGVGNPTNLAAFIAYGGGYGKGLNGDGGPGGSGGGGSRGGSGTSVGGTGVSGQGYAGGTAVFGSAGWAGAGGGGATAVGASVSGYDTGSVSPYGGLGGAGKTTSITGTPTTFSTGGQGYYSSTVSGNAGANTGDGGGGTSTINSGGPAWAGGSGIVIIAFPNIYPVPTLSGLSYTEPTRAGYRVYRIYGGAGTFTFN
jgi:hypothetical protein